MDGVKTPTLELFIVALHLSQENAGDALPCDDLAFARVIHAQNGSNPFVNNQDRYPISWDARRLCWTQFRRDMLDLSYQAKIGWQGPELGDFLLLIDEAEIEKLRQHSHFAGALAFVRDYLNQLPPRRAQPFPPEYQSGVIRKDLVPQSVRDLARRAS